MAAMDLVPVEVRVKVSDNILRVRPVPCDDKGDPLYSDSDWVDELVLRVIRRLSRQGHEKELETTNPPVAI